MAGASLRRARCAHDFPAGPQVGWNPIERALPEPPVARWIPRVGAILSWRLTLSGEQRAGCLHVCKSRVAHVLQRGYRKLRSFFTAEAAGILNENRPEA